MIENYRSQRCLACHAQPAAFARGSQGEWVLRRPAGKSLAANVYRSFVRSWEVGFLLVLKARLTTQAVSDTTTSIAAVETAAAITATT
jgi:hypothetical protein